MLALVMGEGAANMEKDFDSKLRVHNNNPSSNDANNAQRSTSFVFRAPQENFSAQDFELGKIYGVGSYSKVIIFFLSFFLHDTCFTLI